MENWSDRPTLAAFKRQPRDSAESHEALVDLLNTVADCEANWTLDDRIDLALAVAR